MLYFSHYLSSSKYEAGDEVMVKVQHQFQEVKVNIKAGISSKKKLHTQESFTTDPVFHLRSFVAT